MPTRDVTGTLNISGESVEIRPERGFGIVNFIDHNGVECSLQQSSAIDFEADGGLDNPGSSFIWLGCNNADPQYFVPYGDPAWRKVEMPEQYIANTRMHLSREQVRGLIDHLQSWLDHGDFVRNPLYVDDKGNG